MYVPSFLVKPQSTLLTCELQGFRGDCLVFGAKPGACVSYFDFQPANSTEVSDRFNNKVTSLSVNTGGNCQWYLYAQHFSKLPI